MTWRPTATFANFARRRWPSVTLRVPIASNGLVNDAKLCNSECIPVASAIWTTRPGRCGACSRCSGFDSELFRRSFVTNTDDDVGLGAAGHFDFHLIVQTLAQQSSAERRVHADATLRGIEFIRTHDAVFVLRAAVVLERHPGAEKYT